MASGHFPVLWRTLNSDISTINSTLTTTTNTATSAYNKAFQTAGDLKEYYAYLKNTRVICTASSGGFINGYYAHPVIIRYKNDINIIPVRVYVSGGSVIINQGATYKFCIPAQSSAGVVFDPNTETISLLNIPEITSTWICGVEFALTYTFSNNNIWITFTAKSSKTVNCFEYLLELPPISISAK